MKDGDSVFGVTPEGFDRLVFEVWKTPDVEEPPEQAAGPAVPVEVFLEQPGACIGSYKLIRVLGEGGMGIVYLAEQERPFRRQVALKVIKPDMASERARARFETEAQVLALMEHAHVARVYDVGLAPSGRPYLVMEHVQGVPITTYCDTQRLPVEERLRLFIHVCEAVQYAHHKRVIHCDLKPSNILITVEDGNAVPKVIDFGIAQAVRQPVMDEQSGTAPGPLVGTPEYMSPEQADPRNRDIDTRTDVYSLGVVLYELVAGAQPFDSRALRARGYEGAHEVICREDPQTPSTRLSTVKTAAESADLRGTTLRRLLLRLRGDLDAIVMKAMEKDRVRRYPSAGEFAADILRNLHHEPVMAERPSPVYRARKFVRRHRSLVTGLGVVLGVLVAGMVVSLLFAVRAQRAREESTVVTDFLQNDVFGAIDGWEVGGRRIDIAEFLDAASRKVPEKFGDAPLREASIRKALAALYLRVDRFDEAESHLRQSLALFTREVGAEDPRTVEVVDLLGQMYWHRWRYGEAEVYLSQSLQGKLRLFGPEDPHTLKTMAWLGWARFGNGRLGKAESILAEACGTARRTLGDHDPITVESLFYLGSTLLSRGEFDGGKRTLEEALRLSEGVLQPAHPWVGFPTALLGRQYSREGRYEEAQQILTQALSIAREAWGERSASTFHNVAALAENHARQGRIDEAEALLLDALERSKTEEKAKPLLAVHAAYHLGFFYTWQRRFQEAERQVRPALEASIAHLGDAQLPIAFMGTVALAMVLRGQGRYTEAERLLEPVTGLAREFEESTHIANVLHELAVLRMERGKHAEAEELLLGILSARRNLLVEDHPHTLGTLRGLIALNTAWGKPAEARKWLAELAASYARRRAAGGAASQVAGSIRRDVEANMYTLTAPPSAPWTVERELDFKYFEPCSDMWHVCDEINLAHRILQGDGVITARIERIAPPHYHTQAGVMIRDGLDPAAPCAAVTVSPLGEVAFICRTVELRAARPTGIIAHVVLPCWVRLARAGNVFTAEWSLDGSEWEPLRDAARNQPASIEISMGETVHIGLTLASQDRSRPAEVRMSGVAIEGKSSGPPDAFDTWEHVGL